MVGLFVLFSCESEWKLKSVCVSECGISFVALVENNELVPKTKKKFVTINLVASQTDCCDSNHAEIQALDKGPVLQV